MSILDLLALTAVNDLRMTLGFRRQYTDLELLAEDAGYRYHFDYEGRYS